MVSIDHVAVLVESIDRTLSNLSYYDCFVDEINCFPNEGTKEVYIGNKNQSSRLLLMEPISDGPYLNALKKRGPGLHHIGINVPNLNVFISSIMNSGWYLHLHSWTSKEHNTVWLARSQTPLLIELHENSIDNKHIDNFISKIYLNNLFDQNLFKSLNISQIEFISALSPMLSVNDVMINLNELIL